MPDTPYRAHNALAGSAGAAYAKARQYAAAHKFVATIIALVVLGGAWYAYGAFTSTTGQTRYILGTVEKGTIVATVTASGQISANQSLSLTPKVSGQILYVGVKPGQQVGAGALIAEIDPATALKAVRDAKANLASAQLSLQKTQAGASAADSARSELVSLYLDLPGIITGLGTILGHVSGNQFTPGNLGTNGGENYRKQAGIDNDAAQSAYKTAVAGYQNVNLAAADATQLAALLASAKNAAGLAQAAVASATTFLNWYEGILTPGAPVSSQVTTDLSTLTSDATKLSSHLSSLATNTSNLSTEPLNNEASVLDVTKAQNALTDAENSLDDYYIRAPFAGTIGSVSAHAYDQAGGAALATLITPKQIADLSLNEVDAAKIVPGQKATLTFDAIPELTFTGTVAVINPVGTVTQGVVSYDVQIALDTQDSRVKTGMTVNASIQTAVHQGVLTVPSSAVKTQSGQSYVLAFDPPLATTTAATGGAAGLPTQAGVLSATAPVRISVTTGISDDTSTEILDGLDEGQQIVVRSVTGTVQTTTSAAARTTTTGTTGGNRGFGGAGGAGIRIP